MRKHGRNESQTYNWIKRETEDKKKVSVRSGRETYLWSVSSDRRPIIKH